MPMRFDDEPRANALFAAFALSILLVVTGYRYGWQSFHHTIPPDKLAIDIETSASTAAALGLVLELAGSERVPAGYVRTVGENANEELREEWSHARERDAPGDDGAVLAAYRGTLAELDTVTGGMAAPSFERTRADSSRQRLRQIEGTLRALAARP